MTDRSADAAAPFIAITRDGAVCVAHEAPALEGDRAFELVPAMKHRALSDAAEVVQKHVDAIRLLRAAHGDSTPYVVTWPTKGWRSEGTIVAGAENTPERRAELVKLFDHVWTVGDQLFASTEAPPADPRVEVVRAGESTVAKLAKSRTITLIKDAGDQQLVTGIVLEPETVDSQGDIYSAPEVARAAHGFMADHQNVGLMHKTLINEGARVVESFLAPVDMEIGGQAVKKGTWLMTVHVTSAELWKRVRDGELTGFSIGGFSQRNPI